MAIAYPLCAWLGLLLMLGGCAGPSPYSQPSTPAPSETTNSANADNDQAQAQAQASLQRQAARGDLDSQFQLGSLYFVRQPKDLKQAEYWWRQAADKGHALAAVSLAYLYTGRDKAEYNNPPLMLKYLNQSAAGGNSMAQHILGTLYLRGEQGVALDIPQAKRLFTSACQQNYPASCRALENIN